MSKKVTKLIADNAINKLYLENNHNWICEVLERNKNNMDKIALFYRGNKITYREYFNRVKEYAKALKSLNINQDSEVPICFNGNTPELVYLLGAVSLIGARIMPFGMGMDSEYTKDVILNTKSKVAFIQSDNYKELKPILDKANIEKIIVTTLCDSLPVNEKNEKYDPFIKIDSRFSNFTDNVNALKQEDNKVMSIDDFLKNGTCYIGKLFFKRGLDDEFTTTFSSGTTNTSRPKAIVHCNRSYIIMGRFHDVDLSEAPSMKGLKVLSLIPPFSNTDLVTSVSDPLMQGGTCLLEPIYNVNFFPYSLQINKPTFAVATTSFWINAMKKYLSEKEFKNCNLKFLMAAFAVGEGTSIGEEKFINKGFNKLRMGMSISPIPLTLSIAGGDCEHGGLFFTMFKALQEKNPFNNKPVGMNYFKMVEPKIFNENGCECNPYEIGMLVANSPCTMKEYKNNSEANKKFYYIDNNGKKWANCGVFAYKNDKGRIFMKSRYDKKLISFPPFLIADEILLDTKNIMSCNITVNNDNENLYYIASIEFQPFKRINQEKVINSAISRCENKFGKEITDRLFFKVFNNDNSYPLTHCGKRDTSFLDTLTPIDCLIQNTESEKTLNEISRKLLKEN